MSQRHQNSRNQTYPHSCSTDWLLSFFAIFSNLWQHFGWRLIKRHHKARREYVLFTSSWAFLQTLWLIHFAKLARYKHCWEPWCPPSVSRSDTEDWTEQLKTIGRLDLYAVRWLLFQPAANCESMRYCDTDQKKREVYNWIPHTAEKPELTWKFETFKGFNNIKMEHIFERLNYSAFQWCL